MTHREILMALQAKPVLLTMLAEEIGEIAVIEPDDDAGGRTWSDIGQDVVTDMLTWPLDD